MSPSCPRECAKCKLFGSPVTFCPLIRQFLSKNNVKKPDHRSTIRCGRVMADIIAYAKIRKTLLI